MTLSVCSTCKNATDDICLLGQSYIDIYQSVQAMAEEHHRDAVAHQLAPCSFWEESEILKLISREVTLTQHAWSRIAYIKLQKADQEMFAGLINTALSVVHNPSEPPALVTAPVDPSPAEPVNDNSEENPEDSAPLAVTESHEEIAPEAESTVVELSEPGDDSTLNQVNVMDQELDEDVTPAAEDDTPITTDPPEPKDNNLPAPAVAELPDQDESVALPKESQPHAPDADSDPIEQAMQELWSIALASNGTSAPPTLQWGRGSGRISAADALSFIPRADRPQSPQSSLPGIA